MKAITVPPSIVLDDEMSMKSRVRTNTLVVGDDVSLGATHLFINSHQPWTLDDT